MLDRRTLLATGAALMAAPAIAARKSATPNFPKGFYWGAATAPHQVEGNNIASDLWFLENQQPTVFSQPSGDACNSFALWETDLDLVKAMGLNAYRFGIEWARIEPEKGLFSQAMLDHYKAVIDGCHARGLAPIVTFSHFTAPRWFSAQGGWTNPESAQLFARYCDKAMRALGQGIASAITLNEPNILLLLKPMLPPQVWDIQKLTLETAAKRLGVPKYVCANVAGFDDLPAAERLDPFQRVAGQPLIGIALPDKTPEICLACGTFCLLDRAGGFGQVFPGGGNRFAMLFQQILAVIQRGRIGEDRQGHQLAIHRLAFDDRGEMLRHQILGRFGHVDEVVGQLRCPDHIGLIQVNVCGTGCEPQAILAKLVGGRCGHRHHGDGVTA